MNALIKHMAHEMAAEAHFIGFSKITPELSTEERMEAWATIGIACLMSLRNELGPTIVDRIVAPEKV